MSSDKHLTVDDLSPDQREVYDQIWEWWKFNAKPAVGCEHKALLTIGGLGGSGKSTLIGVFAASTNLKVAYVTYTGRAASVLERKLKAAGVKNLTNKSYKEDLEEASKWFTSDASTTFCGTLHRLLYRPKINEKEELLGFEARAHLDRRYDLICVDESSMLSDEIFEQLKLHKTPILAVGDHGQLPPVMARGDLMKNPMLRLEKIHRQAADNPIIAFAHKLRETGKLDRAFADGKRVRFESQRDLPRILAEAYEGGAANPLDVGILCWTNRKRCALNATARKKLNFEGPPKKGEIMLALRNSPPVYNGMRGVLASDAVRSDTHPWKLHTSIAFPEEGLSAIGVTICEAQLYRERTLGDLEELAALGIEADRMSDAGKLFDWGYALTVHKSQGSQFKTVVWLVDRPAIASDPEWRRFAYTAATRASDRLIIVM